MLSLILFITSIVSSRGKYISKPRWKHNDPNCRGNKLFPGKCLKAGEFLLSNNCIFELSMQTDGNLVIYKNVVGFAKATWSSGTSGGTEFCYQEDGNACVYGSNGAEWCTSTRNLANFPTEMRMQDDGNLVVYKEHGSAPEWHSNTYEDLPEDANACFSCSNVEITNWQIVSIHAQPGTRKTNQRKFSLSQCNLPANQVQQSVTRTTTTDVTQSYSFSKSMSSTFTSSMTSSVSITASAGVSMAGIDASLETTAKIDSSQSFSATQGSSSTNAMTTRKTDRLEKSYSFPLFYPSGKRTSHYLWDKSYQGIVEWKAVGTCYSAEAGKPREVLESQEIRGTYYDVNFSEVVNDHDQCDCVTGHCTGMSYPGNTPAPDSDDNEDGNDGGSGTMRCGTDWANANSSCGNKACPDGSDSVCPSGQSCFGQLTKCEAQKAPSTKRCGSSWGAANGDCGATACPSGTNQECASGQNCYGDLKECAARGTADVAESGSLGLLLVCGGLGFVALVLVGCYLMRTKEYDDIPNEEDPLFSNSGRYHVVA